ncbi:MAG: Holliday junction branch migration protein RuvA [Clostridia bacterium]|nr:Holliday junction branch migration protein RuvA [Clostridia bacterium]
MFAYIKGTLEMKLKSYAVIDVGGLGYKIYMPENNINTIGEIGENVKVYTYYRVREDDISIYGFNTQEQLKMFELLLSVSGIGAKSALMMLSCIEPSDFAIAVVSNNVKVLTQIPGIGAKSAQRIILELKDKIQKEQSEEIAEAEKSNININSIEVNNNIQEAISALSVLGYNRKDIEKALEHLAVETLSLEDIIKKGLILLTK